ncbi:MAG TPA: tetratricopeptide repeat protein [Planctomycetota bacterium]|nr:tetratricopeptide repeat protein [Planctomycetota bacterium]
MEFDKLWNYSDPATTERKFREVLPEARDPDTRLQLLTQIARTLSLRRMCDEAHAVLDGVERELTPDLPAVRVRYLLERGRTLNTSKQPERARPLFLEAWELGRAAGLDFHAIDAAHMMAIVDPPERKLAWNEKAMAAAEASTDPRARGWLGTLYNNIGWDYHAEGRYEDALEVHGKALRWFRENRPGTEQERIARWSVARQLRAVGRVDEALAEQRRLAELKEDGFVEEELGECLLLLGREGEARPHFRRAHEMLGKIDWVAEDTARIARLARLGGEGAPGTGS